MIQKHKFVEQNIKMLRKLTNEGYVSPKLLSYYSMYKLYMSIKMPNKTDRYKEVSNQTKNSTTTVRRAVSEMKAYVRD